MAYTFDQVGTFFVVLIGLLGFVVLVANVSNVFSSWYSKHKRPVDDIGSRVESLEHWREDVDKKLDGDWNYRQEQRDFNSLMLKGIDSLVTHAIDKENKDQLVVVQKELGDYMYNHLDVGK